MAFGVFGVSFGDEDWEYPEELTSVGVRVGTEGEIGRVPAVYEEKTRWNLSDPSAGLWSEEAVRDNYVSAKERLDKVRAQVQKDVEKGGIMVMSLEEARAEFGSSLKVASGGGPQGSKLGASSCGARCYSRS